MVPSVLCETKDRLVRLQHTAIREHEGRPQAIATRQAPASLWLRQADASDATLRPWGHLHYNRLASCLALTPCLCCCRLELSGRRPLTGQRPQAPSASRQARAIRLARKLPLRAGTPFRARVGLTGRTPYPPHARAPSGVCVLDSIAKPSLPSLGRPRVVPAAPIFGLFGKHRFLTRARPLNVHKGQRRSSRSAPTGPENGRSGTSNKARMFCSSLRPCRLDCVGCGQPAHSPHVARLT